MYCSHTHKTPLLNWSPRRRRTFATPAFVGSEPVCSGCFIRRMREVDAEHDAAVRAAREARPLWQVLPLDAITSRDESIVDLHDVMFDAEVRELAVAAVMETC